MSGADDGRRRAASATRTLIVLPTWNHLDTTTRPCLESWLRFTGSPFRVVVVDGASADGTRAFLDAAARGDERVIPVPLDSNVGWARATLTGLERLEPDETHVVLLNSDTI